MKSPSAASCGFRSAKVRNGKIQHCKGVREDAFFVFSRSVAIESSPQFQLWV
jgi:hypothetical protein